MVILCFLICGLYFVCVSKILKFVGCVMDLIFLIKEEKIWLDNEGIIMLIVLFMVFDISVGVLFCIKFCVLMIFVICFLVVLVMCLGFWK